MKTILFALIVTGLLVFTSYRAMTFEPDPPIAPSYVDYGGYATPASAGLHRSMDGDNGPWLIKEADGGSAKPLRAGKGSTWEGGVRVPTIAWWPGKIAPKSTSDVVAGTIDLLPTIARLIGGQTPASKIDGEDRWPLIAGQPDARPRETFYYYAGDELHAVRSGPWKLHLAHEYLSPAQPPGKNGSIWVGITTLRRRLCGRHLHTPPSPPSGTACGS